MDDTLITRTHPFSEFSSFLLPPLFYPKHGILIPIRRLPVHSPSPPPYGHPPISFFFFFNDPAPPEISPLSLPAAFPIPFKPTQEPRHFGVETICVRRLEMDMLVADWA